MNSISISGLAVAASLLISPVAASAATTGADKNAAATGEKKICRQLPSSSSRLPQRVCLTQAQWKKVDEENR
ncbi:MAG TPA: hypothetical protein VM145_00225 [Sphingomicrobium sp.]|nr:hypothetical protein [Sphingomicrobium sp.]